MSDVTTIAEAAPRVHQSECPYIPDGREMTIEYFPFSKDIIGDFDRYLGLGYRRIGASLYRTVCEGCTGCASLRVDTGRFAPSRSQRRTLRANRDVTCEIARPYVTDEKIALYRQYQTARHEEREDERDAEEIFDSLNSLYYGAPVTMEMNYRIAGRLFAVGIIDCARDAVSSNYFFYDPSELKRRPGILSMITEIDLARRVGKRYFYPGFYIAENPKMTYKKHFRPNQILIDGQWEDFIDDEMGALP